MPFLRRARYSSALLKSCGIHPDPQFTHHNIGDRALVSAHSAHANIDLEWRPLAQTVEVGSPVEIGIFAVSDSEEDQSFNSAQIIITWDPDVLLLTSSFDDLWGDALWTGLIAPGHEMMATPAGTLLTTIAFGAVSGTPETLVSIVSSLQVPGYAVGHTQIVSGTYEITGVIGGPAAVEIVPTGLDCNDNGVPDIDETISGGDFDNDGQVDLEDHAGLADCLAGPGETPTPTDPNCVSLCLDAFDFDYDQDVDLLDFGEFQVIFTGGQSGAGKRCSG